MFGFLKKCLFYSNTFFSCNALKCVPMNNQYCKMRSEIICINSNEPTFYLYSTEVNKCSDSCNNINDPYSKLCVPDVIKNINVKVFNLMSRTNETKHIKWHETCKFKCRLDTSVFNNKQRWNYNKYRCEYDYNKYRCELIDNGRLDKRFIYNPSNCDCDCDKLCDVGEYLHYKNCNCRKKLVDRLAEECSENIDGNKIIYFSTLNNYEKFTILVQYTLYY